MNGWPALDRFLRTDPRDAGCGKAVELLHTYAEIVVADPRGAEQRHPEVAAHLRACGPCAEDLEGLLAAIRTDPRSNNGQFGENLTVDGLPCGAIWLWAPGSVYEPG